MTIAGLQLAERLNLPNVLQTNLVLEFMEGMSAQGYVPRPFSFCLCFGLPTSLPRKLGTDHINPLPIMYRNFTSKEALLEEYKMEVRLTERRFSRRSLPLGRSAAG